MKHADRYYERHREHHPMVGFGLFLILLGVALLVATNDLLHLGGIREYFTWETALIFVGALLLLNLHFTGGILFIAGGAWFLLDDYYGEIPQFLQTIYWPAVLMLVGVSFIISSLVRRYRNK